MKTTTCKSMNGAEIVIETLIEQGVTDVFGYPGGQVLTIYDALYNARGRISHVLTAHEQGASHAADGYARATGKVGVVIATSGPGATNLVTGIATAMLDSIPLIAITGNVSSSQIGKDSFQEINITGVTMPITKHNYFVSDVADLADTIREAFRIAKSGRPGPVLIDIPKDVQTAECLFTPQGVVAEIPQKDADESLIAQAVSLINAAERPYLYVGGGAASAGAAPDITALADKIDACIGCTFMGLTAGLAASPRYLGMQGMHGTYVSSMANKEADLIIGIGVRFSDRATGDAEKYARNAKVIHIDADFAEIGKNIRVDCGISGNIRTTVSRILEQCRKAQHPKWTETVLALKEEGRRIVSAAEDAAGSALTPPKIFACLNAAKDSDTVISTDVGQHQMWTAQYAVFDKPRKFSSSGGLGTMGFGLGSAIGACIGTQHRSILVTGDGSFGMNLTELATAVSYNLPVTVILVNNGVLGMVRQWQTLFYGKRYSHTLLNRKTDFVKLAEAFGAKASRASTAEEFAAALSAALSADGPYLIDTVIDKDEFVLPMLPPGGCIDDIITAKEETA